MLLKREWGQQEIINICLGALMPPTQLLVGLRNSAKVGDFIKHTREPRTSMISFSLLIMAGYKVKIEASTEI